MLLKNTFFPIKFGCGEQHYVLDFFSGVSGNKKIELESDSNVVYAVVLDNSNVDFSFDVVGTSAKLEIYGIFVGDVKSQVITSLLANKTFARVNFLCVVKDFADMQVDGNVVIGKDLVGVEGHLVEEQFLLGAPNHLFVRPVLDIHSHRVKASHGAKIHSLDPQKMFYIMSKGLSLEESQKMVINSGFQSVFDRVLNVDDIEKNDIFQKIINSVFTSSKVSG